MSKKLYPLIISFILALSVFLLYFSYHLGEKFQTTFKQKTLYTPAQALSLFLSGQKLSKNLPSKINFLVLGLDERNDSIEKTKTTDTIIFAQLDFSTRKIHTLSLPRDTNYPPLQIKINSLYPLSLEQKVDSSTFLKEKFQEITGQQISHIVIIKTQTLKEILAITGPVEISLPYEINDTRYPNPDYIQNPIHSIPIYKTVHFNKGKNTISSDNVLEFVRTRKGSDDPATGGTDIGRTERQQLLITALLQKLNTHKDINIFLSLYRVFQTEIQKTVTDTELVAYLLKLFSTTTSMPSLYKSEIDTTNPNSPIYNPGTPIKGRWIFVPYQNSFDSLHSFINKQFSL